MNIYECVSVHTFMGIIHGAFCCLLLHHKYCFVNATLMGSGVAEWARALTGDRMVNGSSPAAVKTFRFASELWQFRLPRLASVFRMRH